MDSRVYRVTPQIHIEAPDSFALPSRYLRLRGWCFLPGTPLVRMKLVLPDRELFGRARIFRPDVRAVFPTAPDDFSGFELWALIPSGQHQAELQFMDSDGAWHTALKPILSAPRAWRPAWSSLSRPRDLVEFQLGARASHAPRSIVPEQFPKPRTPAPARPKIAVVTPSFNQRPYLATTLDSVLSQAGVDLTYLVQDGGSTDGSVELLQQYTGRLTAWESAPDHGQAEAVAKGFACTTGGPDDVMAWLNSDDVYLPGALAFVADYFARHPNVDVVYGQRVLIDEHTQEVGRWFLPPHDDDLLRLNDYVPQEAMFWRRRLWDRVGGLNPSFKFAMDWDLLLRFQAAGARIRRVPYFLACFRIHDAQKTSAQMESLGHQEIDTLRTQTQGRLLTHAEVENHPRLLSYLRRSAWQEFLWRRLGIRGR